MFLSKFFKHTRAKVLTALAGLTVVFGTAAAVSTVAATQKNEIVETKADVWPQSPTFYFVPSENWMADNAVFGIDCYDNTNKKGWVPGTKVGTATYQGRDVYKMQVTNSDWYINQIVVFRQSSSGTTWNESAKYVKVDANYGSGTNLLVMDQTKSGSSWNIGSGATWKNTFELIAKTTDQAPSSSTTRIFFNNTDTHWSNTGGCAVRAWGGSASKAIYDGRKAEATLYVLKFVQDDATGGYYYGYADIPLDVDGFQIVKTSSEDDYGASISYYSTNDFTIGTGANRVLFGQSSGNYISTGGAKGDSAGSVLMAAVLAAINTCSSNAYNGYGAYSNLNNYFYSHATNAAKEAACVSLGGVSKTVAEHFKGISERAAGGSSARFVPGPSSEQSPLTLTLWIVLGAGVLGLGAIGAAYFVSKKKERHQA